MTSIKVNQSEQTSADTEAVGRWVSPRIYLGKFPHGTHSKEVPMIERMHVVSCWVSECVSDTDPKPKTGSAMIRTTSVALLETGMGFRVEFSHDFTDHALPLVAQVIYRTVS